MNWTKETPTVDGWYWWRRGAADSPEVVLFMAGGVEHAGWEVACPVDRMHGEWCGPIRPPADVPPLPDEVERLREALRPFAAAARQISPGAGDDTRVYSGGLTAGHYRRARAALEDRR